MNSEHPKRLDGRLADLVGFDILGQPLGHDVEVALKVALNLGAVFSEGKDPLFIFRSHLNASIRDIERHPRGELFQRFLLQGPYEDVGPIPEHIAPNRLSDEETATAITFIYSHMVNCFKGAVTEMLASAPCARLFQDLRNKGGLPPSAQMYVGDVVQVRRAKGASFSKGADQHVLSVDGRRVKVLGVTEVKSYRPSMGRLRAQMKAHLTRARRGLVVGDSLFASDDTVIASTQGTPTVMVTVRPGNWRLSRRFHFEAGEGGRTLQVDRLEPPMASDEVCESGHDSWDVTLRWSAEAIAEAAYEMTFWYMEKVGEAICSSAPMPRSWKGMTPAAAGRNAAKMMLYYAILRCRNVREEQRAIALYNTYGFGYALGMNFKNDRGRREMLWPRDLDELLASGTTKDGSRLQ